MRSGAIGTTAVILLLPVLGGCVTTPVKPPAVALPAAYESGIGEPSIVADRSVSLEAWWLSFGDDQLTKLIEDALANSPTAAKAKAVLQEARANRGGANNALLPSGDPTLMSSATGRSPGKLGKNIITTNWTVSWEVDLFGAERTGLSIADAQFAEARFSYEATRTELAANVATSVIQIQGLVQQLADAKENVRIDEELLRIAKLKNDRGLVGNIDVVSFESDLATARAQALQLSETLRSSQRTLLILLGRAQEPTANLQLVQTDLKVPEMPATLPSDLVARRPDVRRDAATLAVAIGNRKVAKLGYFPTLLLEPIYTGTKSAGVSAPSYSLEGILSQPLLSLPKVHTQVQVATAQQTQAYIGYRQTVDTAFGDAENALAGYQTDLARLNEVESAERSARSAFDAEQRLYQAGYDDQSTLLQREQSWRQAKTNATNLQISTLVDAVTAFKALGGGWTPPTQ